MIDNRKEAMLICLETGLYVPYRLPDSKLPVSGAFWVGEDGQLVHRDLEAKMKFNTNTKG